MLFLKLDFTTTLANKHMQRTDAY